MLLNIIALAIFTHTFAAYFRYLFWQKCLLLLYMGSSLYLVYGARSFAIESMTLLVVALLLHAYSHVLTQPTTSKFQKTELYFWVLLAILLTINYKILLLAPVFAVYEAIRLQLFPNFFAQLKAHKQRFLGIAAILLTPFCVYIVLGMFVGVSWKAYPAHWFFCVNPAKKSQCMENNRDNTHRYRVLFQVFANF